jgi:hypothetical protein
MVGIGLVDQLQQDVAEAQHRIDRRTVGPVQRRQRVEGPEDESGTIHQIDVARRHRRIGAHRGLEMRFDVNTMLMPLEHIEARAIGAFDLMVRPQIQIDRRMAERAAAAIAGDDLGLDGNDLERLHEAGSRNCGSGL